MRLVAPAAQPALAEDQEAALTVTPAGTPGCIDEVGRQRRRRAQVLLGRPVAGFDDLTLSEVLRSVLAATDECPESLDVERFLTDRGHVSQTVELVLVCLEGMGPASRP